VRPVRRSRSIAPERAWELVRRGEARLLDLRTELERGRYGWPPGAPRVSLTRHVAWPGGANTIYLCQHANRSKLTARRGASEIAGGWSAWQAAGLPIERPPGELSGPLPQDEFDRIFSRVPRLTVELVIASSDRGVLLALRALGPCEGLWHLPGGTVRFGEPVVEAVRRVARDELGLTVSVGQLLGYIEYPSHYQNGLDSPVGLAFCATAAGDMPDERDLRSECAWFTLLPDNMHDEQKEFLVRHLDIVSSGPAEER
jgi:ADP-ribose pyrophosphatase YjhB (NUDIX family)/rhodanese-related sulfurtransferase